MAGSPHVSGAAFPARRPSAFSWVLACCQGCWAGRESIPKFRGGVADNASLGINCHRSRSSTSIAVAVNLAVRNAVCGGDGWESNPPRTPQQCPADGFEDRVSDSRQCPAMSTQDQGVRSWDPLPPLTVANVRQNGCQLGCLDLCRLQTHGPEPRLGSMSSSDQTAPQMPAWTQIAAPWYPHPNLWGLRSSGHRMCAWSRPIHVPDPVAGRMTDLDPLLRVARLRRLDG